MSYPPAPDFDPRLVGGDSGEARKTDRPSRIVPRPAGAPGGTAADAAREAKPRLAPAPVWSFRPDGSVRDLAAPDPLEIDFYAMANALSKIARFNGSNPGIAFSVAQHSVMGAEAAFNETGDTRLAAWFLLHDGEEALLGDKPTPAQEVLVGTMLHRCGTPSGHHAREVWNIIKQAWREAGWQAAALVLPDSFQQAHIDDFDRRMCNAEMLALFGPAARAQLLPVAQDRTLRLKGGIRPWAAMKAEERFIETACRFIGEDRLHEQRALHAAHVALTGPHGPHAGEPAGPAAARQTIADGRSALRPSGDRHPTHAETGTPATGGKPDRASRIVPRPVRSAAEGDSVRTEK